MSLLACARQST